MMRLEVFGPLAGGGLPDGPRPHVAVVRGGVGWKGLKTRGHCITGYTQRPVALGKDTIPGASHRQNCMQSKHSGKASWHPFTF